MKLAFVVPRTGPRSGWRRDGARMLAEHLAADRGMEVEVLTTCALDAITWRDELPEGTHEVNGVTVHRILSEAGRDESFHPLWAGMRDDPARAGREDMERWVDLQGPRSPALLDAVAASDADVVAFYPYLYYPTVRGLPLVAERAVCTRRRTRSPRAAPGDLRRALRRCRGFVFHSRSERALVNDRFGVAAAPQVVIGLGIEEPAGVAARGTGTGRPPAPASGSVRRPTSCASGASTTRRGRACCGAGSGPTRSATPARSGWSSWARWSTRPDAATGRRRDRHDRRPGQVGPAARGVGARGALAARVLLTDGGRGAERRRAGLGQRGRAVPPGSTASSRAQGCGSEASPSSRPASTSSRRTARCTTRCATTAGPTWRRTSPGR